MDFIPEGFKMKKNKILNYFCYIELSISTENSVSHSYIREIKFIIYLKNLFANYFLPFYFIYKKHTGNIMKIFEYDIRSYIYFLRF